MYLKTESEYTEKSGEKSISVTGYLNTDNLNTFFFLTNIVVVYIIHGRNRFFWFKNLKNFVVDTKVMKILDFIFRHA